MIIIVYDKRESISLLEMEIVQFMQLVWAVDFARAQVDEQSRKIAIELNMNCNVYISGSFVSLFGLSWEQIFMIHSVLVLLVKTVIPDKTKRVLESLIEAINCAVESALRTDAFLASYDKRTKDIHLR